MCFPWSPVCHISLSCPRPSDAAASKNVAKKPIFSIHLAIHLRGCQVPTQPLHTMSVHPARGACEGVSGPHASARQGAHDHGNGQRMNLAARPSRRQHRPVLFHGFLNRLHGPCRGLFRSSSIPIAPFNICDSKQPKLLDTIDYCDRVRD